MIYGKDWHDVGDQHAWAKIWNDSGAWVGVATRHPHKENPERMCLGHAYFKSVNNRRPEWTLIGDETNLTLMPSLFCNVCNDHGWIKNGKWMVSLTPTLNDWYYSGYRSVDHKTSRHSYKYKVNNDGSFSRHLLSIILSLLPILLVVAICLASAYL